MRALMAAAAAALAAALAPGCAGPRGCGDGDDARDVACRTARAREQLEFGMSRDAALALLGRADAVPPWPAIGDAPARVPNPFDETRIESALGETYTVVRHFVGIERVSSCPFLSGRIRLEPLVFFEGELVGWKWSYVSDLLGRPVGDEQRYSDFGVFCDRARAAADP